MTNDGGVNFRSYEVYQRERVGETTNLANPRDLISDAYLVDPFTVPGVLRDEYPCYRDWVGNRFWLTGYDDVTSVFADDASFETRPKTAAYGGLVKGQDLGQEPTVAAALTEQCDAQVEVVVASLLDNMALGDGAGNQVADLAGGFADSVSRGCFAAAVAGTSGGLNQAVELLELADIVRTGTGWNERDRIAGQQALDALVERLGPMLKSQSTTSHGDVLSALANLGASAADAAITLVELDRATLPASLANLWCLLLTNPAQFAKLQAEVRLMKFAYLEALRHSPPIISADRFARHEVERFGRLLPQGALLHLSAAAANRDPRQFVDPDAFSVTRKDLCRREPRGQYRADGLPAPIAFGHGKPSRLPAVPRQAARSRFALTRDIAVRASLALLERFPTIHLAPSHTPTMQLDRLGGTYRCRDLIVDLDSS